jgi:hypothetical protein
MGTRRRELLQRRTDPGTEAVQDARGIIAVSRYSPAIYRSVSPLRASVSKVRNPPSALGLHSLWMEWL